MNWMKQRGSLEMTRKKMPLFEKTKKYGEKIENSKPLLKKFSSENLNQLFCSQKSSYDKSGLRRIHG